MLVSDYCMFFVFMKVCGTSCVGWIVMAMLPTTLRQSRLSCTMNTKHHLSRYITLSVYSKTSNSGPSEKQTTAVQRTAYHRTNTFRTSDKQTPLNSEQWTLISPRRTLPNAKLPPKIDSKNNADACRPLSLRYRCWIQRLSTIAALLRIVLAFHVSVKQRRGPKMRPHRVQQSQITTPTGSLPNAYNGYFRTRSGGLASL